MGNEILLPELPQRLLFRCDFKSAVLQVYQYAISVRNRRWQIRIGHKLFEQIFLESMYLALELFNAHFQGYVTQEVLKLFLVQFVPIACLLYTSDAADDLTRVD